MIKFLVFVGSTRKASTNKQLAALAASTAKNLDAEVTLIDLKDFEMPLYDGDLEADQGLPENAKRLKQLFVEHDGFFLAAPEYNSSLAPVLQNALDWISRPHLEDEPPLWAYRGKVAAVICFPEEAEELGAHGFSTFNLFEHAGAGFAAHASQHHLREEVLFM